MISEKRLDVLTNSCLDFNSLTFENNLKESYAYTTDDDDDDDENGDDDVDGVVMYFIDCI